MQDIFLSYSTQDRDRLTPLVGALEAQGWTVFWDHRSIKVSEDWHDVVGAAIQQCPCVIVVWSEASVTSRWVKEEALIARDRGVLYPVRIDLVAPPFGFTTIQAADFTDWEGDASHHGLVALKEQLAIRLNLRSVVPPSEIPVRKVVEPALLQSPYVESLSDNAVKSASSNSGFKMAGVVVTLLAVGWGSYHFFNDKRGERATVVVNPIAAERAGVPVVAVAEVNQ